MSFVKISGTTKIREEKIDTMIGLSKRVTLSMAVPEDALVSRLCVDELAKTIVIDDKGIYYISPYEVATIEKKFSSRRKSDYEWEE